METFPGNLLSIYCGIHHKSVEYRNGRLGCSISLHFSGISGSTIRFTWTEIPMTLEISDKLHNVLVLATYVLTFDSLRLSLWITKWYSSGNRVIKYVFIRRCLFSEDNWVRNDRKTWKVIVTVNCFKTMFVLIDLWKQTGIMFQICFKNLVCFLDIIHNGEQFFIVLIMFSHIPQSLKILSYFIFICLILMSQIVLYYSHSTLVLSFCIDSVWLLSPCCIT